MKDLKKIIDEKTIDTVVIGLPINLKGDDTSQTLKVRKLENHIKTLNVKIFLKMKDYLFYGKTDDYSKD